MYKRKRNQLAFELEVFIRVDVGLMTANLIEAATLWLSMI